MKSRRVVLSAATLFVAVVLLFSSCENLFTTSPFAFMQRDPADLTPEQQVTYGEDALASGDQDQMADAYAVLKDSTDPQTQLLAADLALGAVGFESVLTSTVADISGGGDPETVLQDALATFSADDLAMLTDAANLVAAADDSVTPSPEQYAYAAIGLIAVAAADAGGDLASATIPTQAQDFLQAAYDGLQAAGESTDLLDGLASAIGWTAS